MTTQATSFSFECSACGKCCNSSPQLSLPELFHHERRFVGTLTLRRVRLPEPGERYGPERVPVTEADARGYRELAARLLHPLPQANAEPKSALLLATQALYDAESTRCPALKSDGGCGIHHERKPSVCGSVPLEALLPDSLQYALLAERRKTAEYMGADCIRAGEEPGRTVARGAELIDLGLRNALEARRRALAEDKQFWGNSVFASLQKDLLAEPAALARIPLQGFVAIPVAPILLVLSQLSERCHQRVLQFLAAQLDLIVAQRVRPRVVPMFSLPQAQVVRPAARELEHIERTSHALLSALAQRKPTRRQPEAARVEAWLELT